MKPTQFDEEDKYREFEDARNLWGRWMEDEERPLPVFPNIYADDAPEAASHFTEKMGGNKQRRRFNLRKRHKVLLAVIVLEAMVAAALLYNYRTSTPYASSARYNRYSRRNRVAPRIVSASSVADEENEEPCPSVNAGQIYRFVSGIDRCMTQMTDAEIGGELNDAWATLVLRPNVGATGSWPSSVTEIINAINAASQSQGLNYQQNSYMVGEGSQVPASITPRDSNRNLRYVISWGPAGQTPVIFLSAAPDGVLPPGEPAPFLQIISFDSQKNGFNYYQYVNNAQVGAPSSDDQKTWTWAGDSTYARRQETIGQGCFGCHLNGSLNMKELTPPWNNWHSTQATISFNNIPQAVAQDPLYTGLQGADRLQVVFQGAQFNFARNFVSRSINGRDVSNAPELLRRLIETTTVNFAASQTRSQGTSDIMSLPKDFFLYDSVLSGVLTLNYTVPKLNLRRADYDAFIRSNRFALVNSLSNGSPEYLQPGATFFAFYVPVPAFEDTKAIQQLIQQRVVSQQFVAAILMVDFQNPIFSRNRAGLMRYAEQISTGKTTPDPADIPTQFAALVSQAASGQPPCDTSQVFNCTAEQQFLFYYQSDWRDRSVAQINSYFQRIGARIVSTEGVNDYVTLAVSRGVQFSNYPLVCNLREFDLQLPCTSLGDIFVQMNADGTLSPQQRYKCPNTSGLSPCVNSQLYQSFMNQ